MNSIRRNISILISLVGFLFWIFAVLTTKIWWIDSSNIFGLFQVLPVSFWIGFSLNLIGVLLKADNKIGATFLGQMVLFCLMIWGTPLFVEPNLRSPDVWLNMGTTNIIVDTGKLVFSNQWIYTSAYLQWPGNFIFAAVATILPGLSVDVFARIFPTLLSVIFLLSSYTLIKDMTLSHKCQKMSLVLLLFSNVWMEFRFAPLGFVTALLPLVILTLRKNGIKWMIIRIVLFSTLIISYVAISMVLLSALVLWTVLPFALRREPHEKTKHKIFTTTIFGVLFFSWFLFSNPMLAQTFIQGVFTSIAGQTASTVPGHLAQITSPILPILIREVTIVVMTIAAIMGLHVLKEQFSFYASWIYVSLLFLALDFFVSGGFEYVSSRALALGFVVIPIVVARSVLDNKGWKRYRKEIATFLLILSLLQLSTLYYIENGLIVRDSQISSETFWIRYHMPQTFYSNRFSILFLHESEISFDLTISMHVFSFSRTEILSSSAISFDKSGLNPQTRSGSIMSELYDAYTEQMMSNLVYNNKEFEIYLIRTNAST